MARDRKRRRRRDADRERRALVAPGAERSGRSLLGELIRYAVVCAVLLSVAPPVGVGVAFFWGLSLIRRLQSRSAPAGWQRLPEAERAGTSSPPPREPAPVLAALRLAELLERECSARAARLAARGVPLERQIEGDGALRGDPELLALAIGDLLDAALAELEEAEKPRLALELGENLAGSEVWLRIRGGGKEPAEPGPLERASLGPARRIARAHGGRLEAVSAGGAGFELLLTLPKPAPGSDRP